MIGSTRSPSTLDLAKFSAAADSIYPIRHWIRRSRPHHERKRAESKTQQSPNRLKVVVDEGSRKLQVSTSKRYQNGNAIISYIAQQLLNEYVRVLCWTLIAEKDARK